MMNQDKQIMGFIAIALVAVMTIYVSSIPKKPVDAAGAVDAQQASILEPAAGDVVPGSVAGTPETVLAATEPEVKPEAKTEDVKDKEAVPETSPNAEDKDSKVPASTGEAYPVVKIFSSIEECTKGTNTVCHYIKCKGAKSMGKEPEANVVENECAKDEKSGWRAVVTEPNKTAIPDVIEAPAKTE